MRERIRATTETIVDEELEAALGAMQSRQSCTALRTRSPVLTGLQNDQTELRRHGHACFAGYVGIVSDVT